MGQNRAVERLQAPVGYHPTGHPLRLGQNRKISALLAMWWGWVFPRLPGRVPPCSLRQPRSPCSAQARLRVAPRRFAAGPAARGFDFRCARRPADGRSGRETGSSAPREIEQETGLGIRVLASVAPLDDRGRRRCPGDGPSSTMAVNGIPACTAQMILAARFHRASEIINDVEIS